MARLFFAYFSLSLCLWAGERASVGLHELGGGAEGETLLQAGSLLSAEPDAGLPSSRVPWDHGLSQRWTDWAMQAPCKGFLKLTHRIKPNYRDAAGFLFLFLFFLQCGNRSVKNRNLELIFFRSWEIWKCLFSLLNITLNTILSSGFREHGSTPGHLPRLGAKGLKIPLFIIHCSQLNLALSIWSTLKVKPFWEV